MDVEAGDSVKDRLAFVCDRIQSATQMAGRHEGGVRLVAASKSVPVERLRLPDGCVNTPRCEHKPRGGGEASKVDRDAP